MGSVIQELLELRVKAGQPSKESLGAESRNKNCEIAVS